MILTAMKPVNVRIGKPSVNAPNPKFLLPGENVSIKSRTIGDVVNGNNIWIVTESNEFLSEEAFFITEELKSISFTYSENIPQIFQDFNLSLLWDLSKKQKIDVGVIDTGVKNHFSIKQKIIHLNEDVPMNSESVSHGTTMACIIAGNDIENGILGVSPTINSLYSYTLPEEKLTTSVLLDALLKMQMNNVKIINISFSTNDPSFIPDESHKEGLRIQQKIKELIESGFVLVCSVGNDGSYKSNFYPAAYDGVISVAGFRSNGIRDIRSNFWNGVTISMCSESYLNPSHFKHANATSSATAIISGCIACIYHQITNSNKTIIIQEVFEKLSRIIYEFENHIANIPKFETQSFVDQLKLKL